MKRSLFKTIAVLVVLWAFNSASMCTKVVVYGTDTATDPVTHSYSTNLTTALEQSRKALESLGYSIASVDESRNRITTGWKPTRGDSHYLNLFERRDYGANAGAYYQLIVDVFEDGTKIKIAASTVVKSISGTLKSSNVVEKEALTRIDDYMRSPQIEMTNVGVTER